MTPELKKRATQFLQKRYPRAVVLERTTQLVNSETSTVEKPIYLMFALDPDSAVRQPAVVVPNLGSHNEVLQLATTCTALLEDLKRSVEVGYDNVVKRTASAINSTQMVDSPKLVVYTDTLYMPNDQALQIFASVGRLAEIIHEGDMHDSVFISYGAPNAETARAINASLKSQGVKTWFFPEDALPGQKLHRVMSDGIATHDRVLLTCSKESLGRPGVLNEIERVLEREAREGGAEILIPITLDDFVFADWAPTRRDIADQVRARVIAKFPPTSGTKDFDDAVGKLVAALRKGRRAP